MRDHLDEFEPPPPGSLVNLQGFMLLQAFNDPDGVSIPADAMMSIIPFEDSDLVILELPPIVSRPGQFSPPPLSKVAPNLCRSI